MKKTTSILLLLLILLLVACQDEGQEATAVPEPTVGAADTPEEAPLEAVEEIEQETEIPEPTAAPTDTPEEDASPEPTEEDTAAEEPATEEPTAEGAEAGDATTIIPDEQLELMATLAPPPQLSDREPGIHTVPCFPTISPGANEVEGEDYTCGVFTAPQNWDDPDGGSIDLSFMVAKATGDNPEPDPLIFLAGGPGASAVLTTDIGSYQKLRPDRDIILFDIRGVGLSQRLGFDECLVLALQNDAPQIRLRPYRQWPQTF